MTALSAKESMNTIDKFIREVGTAEKTAAEANAEPGSVGGATEHPVKDVDDSTEDADEGFRSKENDADVKKDEGPPSVDNQPIASPEKSAEGKSEGGAKGDPVQTSGSAADDQIQIGTVKEPTGDDPPVETAGVKAEKEDSETSHPARTDNSELDGLKYAEEQLEEMPLEDLAKVASDLSNHILAELAVHDFRKGAGHDDDDDADDDDDDDSHKESADLASQAGYELAGLLTGELDKSAVDGMVQETLEDVIKTASDDADRVTVYLASYGDEMQKQSQAARVRQYNSTLLKKAQGGMPLAPMGGEVPPEAALGGGGEEDAIVEQMLGGGGEAPMEAPMEEGGGEVEELAAILEELGISPEELEAAMAAEGAGEAGAPGLEGGLPPEAGLPPEVGGLPPEAGGLPPEAGLEVEARDKLAAAKKGNAMAGVRDYIQELVSRSRR